MLVALTACPCWFLFCTRSLPHFLPAAPQFGNVFIGVQPTFGYEGDPMRLLFSRSASPHHGFAAYYTFIEKVSAKARARKKELHGSAVNAKLQMRPVPPL